MDIGTSNFTLGERLKEMPMDSPDILYTIATTPVRESKVYEIQAELSAAIDVDIIISQVYRWIDIQRAIGKDLRVYLWSSNPEVEKYVMGIASQLDHLYITVLPMYLKGDFKHDA